MSKLDNCHQQVVNALTKRNWIVNRKSPFFTDRFRNDAYIDIEATNNTNGTAGQHIYVEVKCFSRLKDTAEFHRGIGAIAS